MFAALDVASARVRTRDVQKMTRGIRLESVRATGSDVTAVSRDPGFDTLTIELRSVTSVPRAYAGQIMV